MSDIQRYAFDSFGPGHPGGVIIHADDGVYVLHEDMVAALAAQATAHEAALAEIERVTREDDNRALWDDRQRDAALREALAAVGRTCGHTKYEGCRPCTHDDALAAIQRLIDGGDTR